MMLNYPKRLIEVDLPIKRISAHARREKSIRHGHISTLHIWWARRPLAACRAVICASLWQDPADELCPDTFRQKARELMLKWSDTSLIKLWSEDSYKRFIRIQKDKSVLNDNLELRGALLDFIADFANWDNSTNEKYLEFSRALTQVAHEANGGIPETKPLVADSFAGGGSIPLEALRVGADAFASDLNPIAVLLNKVILEYIPKYGQKLADEVRKWGEWVKEQAEKELGQFYPKDDDGNTPIAYLWARTIISEAPDDGTGIPVEIPLMRSLWLAKKTGRNRALRWVRNQKGQVQTEIVEVIYADGVTRKVRRPLLEIFEPKNAKEVGNGTVVRGNATCPVTDFTTPVASVRKQLKPRKGGADDARLFCVVTTRETEKGRFYRLPNSGDLDAVVAAREELQRRKAEYQGELSLVPDEPLPSQGALGFRVQLYGMEQWGNLFTSRQALALTTLIRLVKDLENKKDEFDNQELADAVQCCLGFIFNKVIDRYNALARWECNVQCSQQLFGRQAISMIWDFGELNPIVQCSGSWVSLMNVWIDGLSNVIKISYLSNSNFKNTGQAQQSSATSHPLPNEFIQAFISDPPYYDSVPYADLSDFFYVWLKRTVPQSLKSSFKEELTPKKEECIVDEIKNKDKKYFETTMAKAMAEGCRILTPEGIGVIVFAHKSTSGWEAQLQAMIDAGWTITASWAIDTEMGSRLRAMNSAALASSIHLVCRPRHSQEIGDWRDVLKELPIRIQEWMPRLASEGIVGADAIFACLGPALEIFSRYQSVEKASGEIVSLKDYLVYVWGAVSQEALRMIFKEANTASLEEDARLTAMWLWTLSTSIVGDGTDLDETQEDDNDDDEVKAKTSNTGYTLEYDSARKIAQGLGVELEKLNTLIEIKKDKARLLGVAERSRFLLNKNQNEAIKNNKKKPSKQNIQISLFPQDEENNTTIIEAVSVESIGETILDRIHQAMLLFASGRNDALKSFLVDEAVGKDQRFWTLSQSLSALYPITTDEKRWIDGVLAKKKGFGL